MAKIGSFGSSIVFKVSDDMVLTPNQMSQEVSARWNVHDSLGSKPTTEFLGAGLKTFSMTVILSASLGVKPKSVLSKIEQACKSGKVENLVIGNQKLGKCYIQSVSESWDYIFNHGELWQATLNIKFSEY